MVGHFEGSIEEVDSGQGTRFQSLEELLRFLGERFQAAFVPEPNGLEMNTPWDDDDETGRKHSDPASSRPRRRRRE
jgi:hypothetical protein